MLIATADFSKDKSFAVRVISG